VPVFPEGRPGILLSRAQLSSGGPAEGTALAFAEYGGRFATIVGRGNVLGAQFHPEKSQRAGIGLLSAFAGWMP
jgi:glutamine amidotransferase